MERKDLTLYFPEEIKLNLSNMADKLLLAQKQIVIIAVSGLISKYMEQDDKYIKDLLESEYHIFNDDEPIKRMSIKLPMEVKEELESIFIATNKWISQSQICVIATNLLLKNYKENGLKIFNELF